jgi:hypothetical protein
MTTNRNVSDLQGKKLRFGDKFRVESVNPMDGVPDYRQGDIGIIADIRLDGVIEIEYLNEPLRLIRTSPKAFKHFRKIDNN